jgi:FolB domain-containing protein
MSVIYLKDLVVEAKHGVHPHEKTTPQRFNISAKLHVDTIKAEVSDDLADTVNWSHIRKLS